MKFLFGLILLFDISFASIKIAYDKHNIYLEEYLNKITLLIQNIKLIPLDNESIVLYELGQLKTVDLAVTSLSVLHGINQNDSKKLSNYTLISPLKSEAIFIAVRKDSAYNSIYDLHNRNINFGVENSSIDLFSLTLMSNFDIVFNQYYDNSEIALTNMISGNGLDAVAFSDNINSKIIKKYKNSIRFISVPNIKGFNQIIFKKEKISQEKDLRTIQSDLVLISEKSFTENNPEIVNQIINEISKHILENNMCGTNINIIKKYSYLIQTCIAKKRNHTSTKKIKILNLVKKIDSVEDIEVYLYALLKNKSFGGLNKNTEFKKLNKLFNFYKEEKNIGNIQKLIIKSYGNSLLNHKGGKKIFKFLQKKGISRGDMIIKSFNIKNQCNNKDNKECQYINSKVNFELL